MLATCRIAPNRGAVVIALMAVFGHAASSADNVEWRSDYDAGRKEASEKGKLLLLDFGTEDCVHCKRMHQTTFRDPAVMKILNERFIALKIDANREQRLAQSLRIQAYPTIVLAGNDGKILTWIEGYIEVNRMVDQLNRAIAQHTPEWMVRSYQEATKATATGNYSRAIALLRSVVEDGKERVVQNQARETLREIEAKAAVELARARQFNEKGQTQEAAGVLTELIRDFAGTQVAQEGTALLARLPEKGGVPRFQRDQHARQMLALARDDFKGQRFLSCLDQCELIITAYRDLPEGKDAERLAAEIKNDPERMAKVCEASNDRLAGMYLHLAESWLKKGNADQAVAAFEKAIRIHPGSSSANQAQARLSQLQNKTIAVPVSFPKP